MSIKLFTNLIADAYSEGAKEWQQKIRTQTDKGSDVAAEKGETDTAQRRPFRPGAKPAAKADDKKAAGPTVVKANKSRKLVAAGTAELVEIEAELNEKKDDAAE